MQVTHRQMALLYELLKFTEPLSNEYLQNHFEVGIKTIREDIRCLNDIYGPSGLRINYLHGKGYALLNWPESSMSDLKQRLLKQFGDATEIEGRINENHEQILEYLFSSSHYGRVDELSDFLSLNSRSVSNLLKRCREELSAYQITIKTKPHYGMILSGQEIHIRYCYADTIWNHFNRIEHGAKADYFKTRSYFSETEKRDVMERCIRFIKEKELKLNQIALEKLVFLIMASHQRLFHQHTLSFSEDQIKLYSYLSDCLDIKKLVEAIEQIYSFKLPLEEIMLIKIYLITNLESISFDRFKKLRKETDPILNQLKIELSVIGICSASHNAWINSLYLNLIQSFIRSKFDVIEQCSDASMKKVVRNSPFSAAIGRLCYRILQRENHHVLGEMVYVRLALAIYSCIRKCKNIKKLNSIAIYTPFDYESGDSLMRRVLDRYSNIIKHIEVISLKDLNTERLSEFNHLVYCGNMIPPGFESEIPALQVDFYFTETDVKNFYEHIVVPTRIYKNGFGKIYYEDYIQNYDFSSFAQFKNWLLKESDTSLHSQIIEYQADEYNIVNGVMNILLFTKKQEAAFSKLILLDRKVKIRNTKFNRIYVHAVKVDGDLIKMKTVEKVIRNLTSIEDTEQIIIPEKLDFFTYYIFDNWNLLPHHKKKDR